MFQPCRKKVERDLNLLLRRPEGGVGGMDAAGRRRRRVEGANTK